MIEPAAGSKDVVSFGPFSLDPSRRLLLKDGAPIVVGARTLDTLIALVARPNEAISKRVHDRFLRSRDAVRKRPLESPATSAGHRMTDRTIVASESTFASGSRCAVSFDAGRRPSRRRVMCIVPHSGHVSYEPRRS